MIKKRILVAGATGDLGERIVKALIAKGAEVIATSRSSELSAYNKKERAANPEGEDQLYPKWQQSQYMHSMFSVHHEKSDNDRYPDIHWASAAELIKDTQIPA